MDALRQEFVNGILELQRTNRSGYLGVYAILRLSNDSERMEPPVGYSRGDFKRTIKFLREFQHTEHKFGDKIEGAIALIRRNWLHREADL